MNRNQYRLILSFFSFLSIFVFSSCGGDKNQTVIKENEMVELKVLRHQAYIYSVKAKKIEDELFWHLDVRQNVYFDTYYEAGEVGQLIKKYAIEFDKLLKPKPQVLPDGTSVWVCANCSRISFKDSDGFILFSKNIMPEDLVKNGNNEWGFCYRSSEKLGKKVIDRIFEVVIEPLITPDVASKIDNDLKIIGPLSLKINNEEYHEIRYQKTRSTAPEEDWCTNH